MAHTHPRRLQAQGSLERKRKSTSLHKENCESFSNAPERQDCTRRFAAGVSQQKIWQGDRRTGDETRVCWVNGVKQPITIRPATTSSSRKSAAIIGEIRAGVVERTRASCRECRHAQRVPAHQRSQSRAVFRLGCCSIFLAPTSLRALITAIRQRCCSCTAGDSGANACPALFFTTTTAPTLVPSTGFPCLLLSSARSSGIHDSRCPFWLLWPAAATKV